MVEQDKQAYLMFPQWANSIEDKHKIGLLSGNTYQTLMINDMFPDSHILLESEHSWDLNEPGLRKYDILIAMNVFMYSNNPALWFENVLNTCRHLFIQDVVDRRRSFQELGADGDAMRYCYKKHFESNFPMAYDIGQHAVKDYLTYDGGANEFSNNSTHFIAHILGNV